MTLRIAALDPGASPTLAFLDGGSVRIVEGDDLAGKGANGRVQPIDRLCYHALFAFPGHNTPDLLVIEDVWGFSGKFAAAAVCRCVGLFRGLATALDIRFTMARPDDWQKWAGVYGAKGANGKKDKGAARRAAAARFPAQAALFKRVKDHNRADAALMAMWGATMAGGGR